MSELTRQQVYEVIDAERSYQDERFTQDPPLPPSDELRLIQVILRKADSEWYVTEDNVVKGTKVNPADLDALRMIGAVSVRAMETWGAVRRERE